MRAHGRLWLTVLQERGAKPDARKCKWPLLTGREQSTPGHPGDVLIPGMPLITFPRTQARLEKFTGPFETFAVVKEDVRHS